MSEQPNIEIGSFSQTFTNEDIFKGIQITNNLQLGPMREPQLSKDEQIEKYQGLKNLKMFMERMQCMMYTDPLQDQTSNGQKGKNNQPNTANDNGQVKDSSERADKYRMLKQQYLKNISLNMERIQPLIDFSDVDFKNEKSHGDEIDMFDRDDEFFRKVLKIRKEDLTDDEYVKMCIKQAKSFFNQDRGNTDGKKTNLGDIKSTKIESPYILSKTLFDSTISQDLKEKTMIQGNLKAIIPLMREKFYLQYEEIGGVMKERYKKVSTEPLMEKRIFGILSAKQTGHIPNLQISFTEDEENFKRDTYMFKNMGAVSEMSEEQPGIDIDIDKEIYKHNGTNDHNREDLQPLEEEEQLIEPGTISQIEIFHKWLMSDLFKRHKDIDYEKCTSQENIDKTKKYYIIPLKIVKKQPNLQQINSSNNHIRYEIDRKLLLKVENLAKNGYKNEQDSIIQWLDKKNLGTVEERLEKLRERILVKEDKTSNCYTFNRLIENLKQISAEEVALAIKGKPENLGCKTGFDLVFEASTRFNCIKSFRDGIKNIEFEQGNSGYIDKIKQCPIILLNPAKPIHNEKMFKYNLLNCPKNPNKKNDQRREMKKKNDLTTNQGMPIFSAYNIYKHYLTVYQWERAMQLPSILSFYERCLNANFLISKLSVYVHPEFAVWATSCQGVHTSRKSYETLETYGDTILKFAATMLAYDRLTQDCKTDEKRINDMKNSFITNLNLYRLGQKMKLREHIHMKDPDPKKYEPPFSIPSINNEEFLSCTGKNLADAVESLMGAIFLSNNLYRTLQFISDIQLVPMEQAGLMKYFPDKDLTFQLGTELEVYNFNLIDTVQDIFQKYYKIDGDKVPKDQQLRLTKLIDHEQPMRSMCYVLDGLDQNYNLRDMPLPDLQNCLIQALLPVEKSLGYVFKNKLLLLEAFTHTTFMEAYQTGSCYEKLEVLGDAVLDYVANSNLIKFTMYEKYNIQERLNKEFITKEDFQPFDAHQAKSMLTKNNFLAQMMCLFGLHEYILYTNKNHEKLTQPLQNVDVNGQGFNDQNHVAKLDGDGKIIGEEKGKTEKKAPEWLKYKKNKESQGSIHHDSQMYIKYSFKKDFSMNALEYEPYKAPKILGDVFEAIIGAVFQDGGIEETIQFLKSIMSPFVLFVAKYSKQIHKEPKEDFLGLATQLKIKPRFESTHETVPVRISQVIGKQLSEQEDILDKMQKVDIIHNNNQIMTTGYGNSSDQAQRNASIRGLIWLQENKNEEIERLLKNSMFSQSLKACFMHHSNLAKYSAGQGGSIDKKQDQNQEEKNETMENA